MTGPAVSVVIPVFRNPAETLRAVGSVLGQSRPAHEIILVDDASGPESRAALDAGLARLGPRVPLCIEALGTNVGPGLARQAGAQRATGDFVAFLDADDQWHREKLALCTDALGATGADLLGHRRPWKFGVTPRDLQAALPSGACRDLGRLDFLKRNPMPTSSIVARRAIARQMFRFGGRRAEDHMALIVAQRLAGRCVFLDAPLCWAEKPPFGISGQGADQIAIYSASTRHVFLLRRKQVIGPGDVLVFLGFLGLRAPIGLVRQAVYKRRFAHLKPQGA